MVAQSGALVIKAIKCRVLLTLVALASIVGTTMSSRAESEVSFAGKQITMMIGYGTGGTYYAYAKLIADHLGRFIPGQPTVIVQSMPGAGGIVMVNTAAVRMPSDGTGLFMPPDTMVIVQLASKSPVHFDARKFHYLATINQQNNFFVVRTALAKSIADLQIREVVAGHSGNGSAGHLIPSVAREVMGVKIRTIAGYKGSRDTLLALERKEIDGATFGWETFARAVPQWFEGQQPFAVPLFQTGHQPDPEMPKIPLLRTFAQKENIGLVELIDTQVLIGRSLAMPPGVSPPLVKQFRKSVQDMLNNAEFKADATKLKLRLMPLSGIELQSSIERAVNSANPQIVARAKKLME